MQAFNWFGKAGINVCASLLISSMLGACVSAPPENKDPTKNNLATYRKDLRECQEVYPEAGSGTHLRQWTSCMNLKGWR
jgi:hypothetical protein